MNAPEVSLVIAVYQRDDFLTRVLTSLLGQTFSNFEVIVADDGSGPAIARVIDTFQGRLAHPLDGLGADAAHVSRRGTTSCSNSRMQKRSVMPAR